jgi:hypothetical protein
MLFGHDKWTAGMRAGVDFTDQRYNRYFYDVDEEYARPDRPAYASRGGYYGTTLSIFIGRDLSERLFFGVYSSWTTIAGAASRTVRWQRLETIIRSVARWPGCWASPSNRNINSMTIE